MAVFVGFDLADVESVDTSLDAYGDRYLDRIYTEEERDECRMDTRKLATRFAAKEATMKALGRRDEALPWRSIEVVAGHGGAMGIVLHGPALELARRRGIEQLSLSTGAAGACAVAVVLGETAS
jgi:holo-[acyl-carrier protein] synthase